MITATVTFIKEVGLSFVPIFIAVDSIGILPLILNLIQAVEPAEQARVIRYAMLTALALGLGFIGIGKGIFLYSAFRPLIFWSPVG